MDTCAHIGIATAACVYLQREVEAGGVCELELGKVDAPLRLVIEQVHTNVEQVGQDGMVVRLPVWAEGAGIVEDRLGCAADVPGWTCYWACVWTCVWTRVDTCFNMCLDTCRHVFGHVFGHV